MGTTVAYCRAERWVLLNTDLETIIMLITLAIVLIILWALGFLAFHVTSGLIHLLLVIAVIVLIFQLVSGRRAV